MVQLRWNSCAAIIHTLQLAGITLLVLSLNHSLEAVHHITMAGREPEETQAEAQSFYNIDIELIMNILGPGHTELAARTSDDRETPLLFHLVSCGQKSCRGSHHQDFSRF